MAIGIGLVGIDGSGSKVRNTKKKMCQTKEKPRTRSDLNRNYGYFFSIGCKWITGFRLVPLNIVFYIVTSFLIDNYSGVKKPQFLCESLFGYPVWEAAWRYESRENDDRRAMKKGGWDETANRRL